MNMRIVLDALLAAGVLAMLTWAVTRAYEPPAYTADDTLHALEYAPPQVVCVVRLETGGTWDPNAIGALGEQGVAQILPVWNGGGEWNEFHYGDWVGLDPQFRSAFDPYLSVYYLQWYLETHGHLRPWSTWPYCH